MSTKKRGNGTGTAIKRGDTWTARVVIGWKTREGKPATPIYRTKGGFKRKKDAYEACKGLLSAPKDRGRTTLKQIYEAWMPAHSASVSRATMDCYTAAWKWFMPIQNRSISDLDLDDFQNCIDECIRGKRTKENMKALVGLLMKYAIPRRLSDLNYADFLTTGSGDKGTHPPFTMDQVEAIRKVIGVVPYAEYVYIMIYTGYRPAEMLTRKKEDYRDGVIYGGIKTEAGKDRAVPVSSKIRPYIRQIMQKNSIYLFPKADGTQMSPNYFRENVFYPTLQEAGIQDIPTKKNPAYYVPYSCRHTFANMLKTAPGSDKDKAALMGHEQYKTTQKFYQSAELEELLKIINAL